LVSIPQEDAPSDRRLDFRYGKNFNRTENASQRITPKPLGQKCLPRAAEFAATLQKMRQYFREWEI